MLAYIQESMTSELFGGHKIGVFFAVAILAKFNG